MSQAETIPALLSAQERCLVSDSVETARIPWNIWLAVAGIAITMIGGTWDFAWHMSIGRDTFWTPPHLTVQTGGILVGIACAHSILKMTFGGTSHLRNGSVRVLGLYGPAGAFLALWGSVAMVASAPFDNWWHNAYGLDGQSLTPPHLFLSLGYFTAQIGTTFWVASSMRPVRDAFQVRLTWLLLFVGTISMSLFTVLIIPVTSRSSMHTAACYLAIALFVPPLMIATASASAQRWGCTIMAVIYTGIGLASEWLLPLIPAQPKLGPVYHNVTHLLPLQFPLLLIVPAVVTDVIFSRLQSDSSWVKAVWAGPAFVLSFFAVQWPFATFLMSPASRNWIFGSAYFAYFDPAGLLFDAYKFKIVEKTPTAFALTLLLSLAVSILSVRLGMGWGKWMRRLRR